MATQPDSATNRANMRRLFSDFTLAEQLDFPGISVTQEDDLFEWIVNIFATAGPAQGRGPLHFHIYLPNDFPESPPKLSFVSRRLLLHFIPRICPGRVELDGDTTAVVNGWSDEISLTELIVAIQLKLNHLEEVRLDYIETLLDEMDTLDCPNCDHTPDNPFPLVEYIAPEVGDVSLMTYGPLSGVWNAEGNMTRCRREEPMRTFRGSHGVNSGQVMFRARVLWEDFETRHGRQNLYGMNICFGWGRYDTPAQGYVGMNTSSIGWEGVFGCWVFDRNLKYEYENHDDKAEILKELTNCLFTNESGGEEKMTYRNYNWVVVGIDFDEKRFVVAREFQKSWKLGYYELPPEIEKELLFPVVSCKNCWFEIDFDFSWKALNGSVPRYLREFVSVEDWIHGIAPEIESDEEKDLESDEEKSLELESVTEEDVVVPKKIFEGWLDLPREATLLLFSFCDEKDLAMCCCTTKPWQELLDRLNLVFRDDLVCEVTGASFDECVLMIPYGRYHVSGQLRYMSHEGREQDRPNYYSYIPLVINEEHGQKADELIHRYLGWATNQGTPTNREDVFYQSLAELDMDPWLMVDNLVEVMNGLVIDFANAFRQRRRQEDSRFKPHLVCENAMLRYCYLSHLLIHLALRHPEVGVMAYNRVAKFLSVETSKTYLPDFGEILIYLMIARAPRELVSGARSFHGHLRGFEIDESSLVVIKYDEVAVKLVVEFWIRQVFYLTRDRPIHNDPFAKIHDYDQEKRWKWEKNIECIRSIFRESAIARHLLVIQAHFALEAMRPDGKRGALSQIYEDYNSRCGRASQFSIRRLQKLMYDLQENDIYKEFWFRMRLRCPLVEDFKQIMKWAVYQSKKKKFHVIKLDVRNTFFKDVKNDDEYPFREIQVRKRGKRARFEHKVIKGEVKRRENTGQGSNMNRRGRGRNRGRGRGNDSGGRRGQGGKDTPRGGQKTVYVPKETENGS